MTPNDPNSIPPTPLKAGETSAGVLDRSGTGIPEEWKNPTIKQLSQEHPDYTALRDTWYQLSVLYEGGHTIKEQAATFLVRRPKELQEIYQARLERFTYDNILGACFGWFRAALFKNPPTIIGSSGKGIKGIF